MQSRLHTLAQNSFGNASVIVSYATLADALRCMPRRADDLAAARHCRVSIRPAVQDFWSRV